MSCARHAGEAEPGVMFVEGDVARDAQRLVDAALAQWGRIDLWVNNAALPGGDFAEVMAINAGGPLACARAVLAACPTARIINVSSDIVATPRAGAAEYMASKAALEGLTKSLARDWPDATIVAVELGAQRTPESAVPALLAAMTSRSPDLHGRIVEAWRVEWQLELSDVDLLAHPLGPSPAARAALAEYAQHGALERYPATTPLPKLLAATHGVALDSIVLGAGASELVDRVLGVVMRSGERLVAHTPTWPLFPKLCATRGLDMITVPYRLAGDRIDHDLEAVLAAVERSVRLVYLISPANPMGCALDAEPFARFLDALPASVTVLVDEAYGEFVTRRGAVDATTVTRRDRRVIAIRTFSKFYGLAALRLGYAVTAPRLARELEHAAPLFGVTAGAHHAAVAALGDREHARHTHALIARGRTEHASALISDAPFALAPVPGSPRYFDGRYALVPLWPSQTT